MPSFHLLVHNYAEQLGATVLDDGNEITVDAPAGKQWVDGSCLQLVTCPWQDDNGKWTSKMNLWLDLWERMKNGLEDSNEEG